MNIRHVLIVTALPLCLAPSLAAAVTPLQQGALNVPANRIVGLWQVASAAGPCGGPVVLNFLSLHTYNAGGTLLDRSLHPPGTRGPGQGVWKYQGYDQYGTRWQFFRHDASGGYDGLTDVRYHLILSADGNSFTATTQSRVLEPDGVTVRTTLCGSATGQRVDL